MSTAPSWFDKAIPSVDQQMAKNAQVRADVAADKAARFSREHGTQRKARRAETVAKYLAMPHGPEREDYFKANEQELFSAAT